MSDNELIELQRKLYSQCEHKNTQLAIDVCALLDAICDLQEDLAFANAKLNGSWPNYDPHHPGHLTVTWSGDQIALVSRQDEDHRILKIIAESGNPPTESNCYE